MGCDALSWVGIRGLCGRDRPCTQLQCAQAGPSPPEPGVFWSNKNAGAEDHHGLAALRIYDYCGVGDSEVHWFIG